MKTKIKRAIWLSVFGVILAVLIACNVVCGLYSNIITMALCGPGVSFEGEAVENARALGEELCEKLTADSVVLLKNENNALPLAKSDRNVNVFGWASYSLRYGGGGSGGGSNPDRLGDKFHFFLDALEEQGIQYNKDITELYRSYKESGAEVQEIVEMPISGYDEAVISEAKNFSDTAIVVISRGGGENLPTNSGELEHVQSDKYNLPDDNNRTFLELSSEEEDLLNLVSENFGKVIVMVNSGNPMHLGILEDERIDAALYVGYPGQSGAVAIAKILTGEVLPSGKLSDTYIYEPESDPSFVNNKRNGDNIQYVEDIYFGYKWYETADAEGYFDGKETAWGTGYDGVVQFPFGYGLTYTDFDWEVTNISLPVGSELRSDSKITIQVTVTNVGDERGKDIVQLYSTPQYYDGGIEKAHVNLMDFAKTNELAVGQSQIVELSVSAYDLASYDCYDKNGNGFTGYELDSGTVTLKLMRNAHELADCENAEMVYNVGENGVRISRDPDTKRSVKNRFTGETAYTGVPIDGSTVGVEKQYLTRTDFEGTFPTTRAQSPTNSKLVSQANSFMNDSYDTDVMPTTDVDSGLRLVKLAGGENATYSQLNGSLGAGQSLVIDEALVLELGQNYYSDKWNTLLDQMTVDELCRLVECSGYRTPALESVGKPICKDLDGPAGLNVNVQSPTASTEWSQYASESLIGCSWNVEYCFEFGLAMGVEASVTNVNGWYAPAVNLHRSAYNARNWEYFSEDGIHSGKMAAEIVRGAKVNGLYCYVKHFALSEPGKNPRTLNTWITEQNLRENYLKPFEICVKEGEANAIMSAFNRVGGTWAGASYPLLVSILRQEWGFKGSIVTDWSVGDSYMNPEQGIRAGNDIWLNPNEHNGDPISRTDPTSISCARTSAKNMLYTYCNTYAFAKTYDADLDDKYTAVLGVRTTKPVFPWWIPILVAIDVIVVGLITWQAIRLFIPKRKKNVEKAEDASE